MVNILLTPDDGAIIGPIAKFLGWIMDAIYVFFANNFGIENVALSIIVLTIVIYTLMLPLTFKQQKFTILQRKMQPELKAVQDKYKNKKDEASVMAMNNETQAIYDKYGVSPMGSCLQMIIQMPIWFALFRVFYNIPAYISSVKDKFVPIAEEIVNVDGFAKIMNNIKTDFSISAETNFVVSKSNTIENVKDYIVDVIYKIPVEQLNSDKYFGSLESVSEITAAGVEEFNQFNLFLGLNISDTPWNIITTNFSNQNWGMILVAVIIPIVYFFVQKISLNLSTATTKKDKKDAASDMMTQQMESMNKTMPLMMVFFCFISPVGLGIYWIASSGYRALQQLLLNKYFENMDLNKIIEKNKEKAKAKQEKRGVYENQIREAAAINTKRLSNRANIENYAEVEAKLEESNNLRSTAKPGSMAAKANMVREYNERNSRK